MKRAGCDERKGGMKNRGTLTMGGKAEVGRPQSLEMLQTKSRKMRMPGCLRERKTDG